MKKILFIALLAVMSMAGMAQISGNYANYQFVNHNTDTAQMMFASTAYPIEVGGLNYDWSITTSWRSTTGATNKMWTVATTSTVRVQASPDNTYWQTISDIDSIKNVAGDTVSIITGTGCPFPYIRLYVKVTSGDSISALKSWYTFKRK